MQLRVTAYAMDWKRNRIIRVGKKTPVQRGTNVHEFWDNVLSLVLSNVLARLSMSCFLQKIFAIKSPSRRKKSHKYKRFLAPIIRGGTTPTFLRQIVIAIYCPPFGKV